MSDKCNCNYCKLEKVQTILRSWINSTDIDDKDNGEILMELCDLLSIKSFESLLPDKVSI